MKTCFFILLISSLGMLSRDQLRQACWAETTSIDRFVVIENGRERTVSSNRADNTQFRFDYQDAGATSIRLECATCEDRLSLKLWSPDENAYTEWIYLDHKESIRLADCFSRHAQRRDLSYLFETARQLVADFWASCLVGRTARKRTPALRAVDPADPRLVFVQASPTGFFLPEDLKLAFQILDNERIQAIYIKDYDNGNLLFHAGATEVLTRQGYDLSSVSEWVGQDVYTLLRSAVPAAGWAGPGVKVKEYSLSYRTLDPLLLGELKPGKTYQLWVQLWNDNSGHNPYSLVFRFFSKAEIQQMEQFARE